MEDTALDRESLPLGVAAGAQIGRITRVTSDGRAFVEFPGTALPVEARWAVNELAVPVRDDLAEARVLMLFEDGDTSRPIIVGFVRERLWMDSATSTSMPAGQQRDGVPTSTLVIEAEKEIVLRCGRGSITLTADGRIVIKGTKLTSRASETNKVRGAVVLIN